MLRASGPVSSVTYLRETLAPFSILAFVELRLPPLISHKETAPSSPRRRLYEPEAGSRVRKTLLPLFIKRLRQKCSN